MYTQLYSMPAFWCRMRCVIRSFVLQNEDSFDPFGPIGSWRKQPGRSTRFILRFLTTASVAEWPR